MAELTRRSLLQTGATAGSAVLLGLRPWAPATAAAAGPKYLRRSVYTGLVASEFAARTGGPIAALRLVAVDDVAGALHQPRLAGSEDAFLLRFAGPLGAPLESDVAQFDHPGLGSFELFVSPVDRPGRERHYEALIDRSVGVPKDPPTAPPPHAPPREPDPVARPAAPQPSAFERLGPGRAARVVRSLVARRKGRGVRVEVLLRPSLKAQRVRCRLLRNGRVVASGMYGVRDGRAVMSLHSQRHLPAGAYVLVISTIDARDAVRTERKRVTLR
jgi:hypothetical protein